MFIAVQIPMADLRPFVAGETGRVTVPGWPNPRVDVEFVRSFGPVRERMRGGLDPWPGEGSYAEATRALRFPPGFGAWPRVGGAPRVKLGCIYRRLYSDGRAVIRAEIGFGPRRGTTLGSPLAPKEIVEAVAAGLGIPLRVPVGVSDLETRKLALVGQSLAGCLLRSTSKKGFDPDPTWLRALRSMAVVTIEPDEMAALAGVARRVALGGDAPTVFHQRLSISGNTVPVWFLPSEGAEDRDLLRRIRLHLFRLHAEREVLKLVMSAAAAGRLASATDVDASDRLQEYLNDTLSLLERGSMYGIGPTEDLASALRLGELVNPGEVGSLHAQLHGIRGSILRRIERAPAGQKLQPITYIKGDLIMGDQIDNSTKVGDINGSFQGNLGSGNTILTKTMEQLNSSPADGDVKTTLNELVEAVAAMSNELRATDPAAAEGAERDADALIKEASSKSPRRDRIEQWGDTLKRTAETVGKVAGPVVLSVAKLVALFG